MAELRRRNSFSGTTTNRPTAAGPTNKIFIHSSSTFPPSLNLELISLRPNGGNSYTSLRDIIPSPPLGSPSVVYAAAGASPAAAIRNRLVKQAAWAYLQPMSASPSSDCGPRFLRRLWLRLSTSADSDSSCLGFFACHVIVAVDSLLNLFHVPKEMQ